MARLFTALVPTRSQRQLLLGRMGGVSAARWQNDAQLHLTLSFIGDAPAAAIERLVAALAMVRHPPVALQISGVGHFDRRGVATTVWAGAEPRAVLAELAGKCARAGRRAGLDPETRAFVPHITLARLSSASGPIGDFLATNAALASPPEQIDRFVLFESLLGNGGSTYVPIAEFPLTG